MKRPKKGSIDLMGVKTFRHLNVFERFLCSVKTINGCSALTSQRLHSSKVSLTASNSWFPMFPIRHAMVEFLVRHVAFR